MTTTVRAVRPSLSEDVVEAERNRLLRRVDWRFLGATPVGAVSICFGDEDLARAVAAVSATMLEPDQPVDPGSCDIAVALDPDAATLRRAWSAVRPGGTCYTEWTRLRAGGPLGIRRRLAGAGWAEIACYAPRPDPAIHSPRMWVPLDSSAATRYFLRQQSRRQSAVRRLARALRRMLWLSNRNARFSQRICAIARKPTSGSGSPRDERVSPQHAAMHTDFAADLLATVREGWEAWTLGPPPRDTSLFLQTGGPRSVSKVIGLVFADGGREPAMVIKLPRVEQSTAPLRTEAEVLRALDGHAGVPRLLFAKTIAGVFTLGESAVCGTPLVALAEKPAFERLAFQSTDWIGTLGEGAPMAPPREWYGRLVEARLEDFVESFGPALDRGMLRETEARLRSLGPLPIVCEHRDFSPWNVLLGPSGQLGVLDWEGAELRGLPALDLIYFLTYWGFFLDGAEDLPRRRASYRGSLDSSSRRGETVRECLERYCELLRVPLASLGPLRLLVWLVHARSEYRRLVEDSGGTPTRASLEQSLFVALWREELSHGMVT